MKSASVSTGSSAPVRTRVFDAHLHIIDPAFPVYANHGFLPESFTVDDYLARIRGLNVTGGAVVSGSFQGFDQDYLTAALARLGPSFVGVTQLPADVAPERIAQLDAAGVRAVRINLFRGGSAGLEDLERLATTVHDVAGWHTELYVDARDLPQLSSTLRRLPRVTVDHLGMHRDGLNTLLRLVAHGVIVKATGFGRVDLDPAEAISAIIAENPSGLIIGSDLPSTRAQRPFADEDWRLIAEVVPSRDHEAVFHGTAEALYRPRAVHQTADRLRPLSD